MKGLNIKRIAAVCLGAALVGSALAPVVSAANMVPTGLDNLMKSNVIDSTGAPAVDVVVGANAAVSDVVWAGNIAARVAQLATKSVGGSETKTVDITVGGIASTTGSGTTAESNMSFVTGGQEATFFPISTTSTAMPALVNNPSWAYKASGTGNATTAVKETLDANLDVIYQSDQGSNRYGAGELLADVNARDAIAYSVTISPGFPIIGTSMTNLDANVEVDYKVPLLGKTYVIDSISSSGDTLVLFEQTNPTTLDKGQSIKVNSATKEYTLELIDIVLASANGTYYASFALKDGETVVDVKDTIAAGTDLKDTFGEKFADSVYVTAVGKSGTSDAAYVSLRTGSSRIELRDGQGFPYTTDPTANSKAQWKVEINRVGGTLNKITISNQWRYDNLNTTTSDTIKNPLKVGEEIVFPNDFAKVKFVGMQTKATTTHTIGNDKLSYKDSRGTAIEVPFYLDNQIIKDDYSKVTINGRTFTFHLYNTDGADTTTRVQYIAGSYDTNASGSWTNVDFNRGTKAVSGAINLDIGAEASNAADTISYVLETATSAMSDTFLVLKGAQTFDLYDMSNAVANELYFVGTDVGEDGVAELAYFQPHVTALGYTDDKEFNVALFSLRDSATNNGTYALGDVNFYVDTRTGNVLSAESNKSDLSTYTRDASHGNWTDSIRDGTDYIKTGLTAYGTEISSDNSVFTIVLPQERRKAEIYLGATAMTTTPTGGANYTGVKVNDTVGNVTVTNITGATTGVEVVPVGSLVRTSKQSGKSIIVGGWLANAAAKNLQVSAGQTLEELVTASGEYVAAVTPSGDIVVAGMTAADTGMAASDLITALEGLM